MAAVSPPSISSALRYEEEASEVTSEACMAASRPPCDYNGATAGDGISPRTREKTDTETDQDEPAASTSDAPSVSRILALSPLSSSDADSALPLTAREKRGSIADAAGTRRQSTVAMSYTMSDDSDRPRKWQITNKRRGSARGWQRRS
jgi:hypothetical protein